MGCDYNNLKWFVGKKKSPLTLLPSVRKLTLTKLIIAVLKSLSVVTLLSKIIWSYAKIS